MSRRTSFASLAVGFSLLAPALDAQAVQYKSPTGAEYIALRDTGAMGKAIIDAEKALVADPRNAQRFIELGIAKSGARLFKEAIATFESGLAIDPNNAMLYRWRGHRYLSIRDFDKAETDLMRGLELDGKNYGCLYHLGIVKFIRGDFAAAAELFRRAVPLAPDAAELAGSTDWRWMSLARAGKTAEAKAWLDQRTDNKPVTNAYSQRLRLYRGQVRPEQLITPADTADVQAATLHFGLGNWYLVKGDTAKAKEHFTSAVKTGGWPGFGFIVSEVELARLR